MGRLVRGNLGFSFFYNLPASTVIARHVAPTLFLVIYSAVLAAAISFPVGFGAGLRRGGVRHINGVLRGEEEPRRLAVDTALPVARGCTTWRR